MAGNPDYLSTYSNKANSILAEYIPLMSDYNSMALLALNGLVPDDNTLGFANNTFSNKNIIILEPLKYHINETVSLNSTDIAIKGDVYLSDEAIILKKKDFFDRLSDDEKKSIEVLNFILIGNNLTEEINNVLINNLHVQPESLSLSPYSDYSSEEFKQNIALVIELYKLSYKNFFDILVDRDSTSNIYDLYKDEYPNNKLFRFFDEYFFNELMNYFNVPYKYNTNDKVYCTTVINIIKKYGIDKYKEFVTQYNIKLKELLINGELLTPDEMINSYKVEVKK